MNITMTKLSKEDLTPELLKEYLSYNPLSGELTWIKRPSKKVHTGSRAGTLLKTGYRAINIFGRSYQEHHIIWFMYYGEWVKEIDHANHVKSDNSIDKFNFLSKFIFLAFNKTHLLFINNPLNIKRKQFLFFTPIIN